VAVLCELLQDISIAPKVLQSIAITAPANTVPVGEGLQFTATATYDDSSTEDITASATWTVTTVDPAGAAAFDAAVKGRLNALKQGNAVVKAAKDGKDRHFQCDPCGPVQRHQ
jgi:uncharacterized protein YjdB